MSDLIETNPEILGGKPIIKGTRVPVALIFELVGLDYSIEEILEEYPHLDRQKVIKIIELGRDALNNLSQRNVKKILEKEVH